METKKRKYTILEITDWEKDNHAIAGDMSHMPEWEVYGILAEELKKKTDENEWPGLPFVCMAVDEDDAIEQYRRKYCEYDYVIPIDADFEEDYEFEDDEDEEDGSVKEE